MHLSAASAGPVALVAISRSPVGIDILSTDAAPDARSAIGGLPLHADATPHRAHLDPDRLALRLWTQLEATLKAAGLDFTTRGVASRIRADAWRPDLPCTLRLDLDGHEGRRWRVDDVLVDAVHVASIAVPGT